MDANTLVRIRHDLAITQTQLAKALGVTRQTVGRWETGGWTIPGPAKRYIEILAANPHLLTALSTPEPLQSL